MNNAHEDEVLGEPRRMACGCFYPAVEVTPHKCGTVRVNRGVPVDASASPAVAQYARADLIEIMARSIEARALYLALHEPEMKGSWPTTLAFANAALQSLIDNKVLEVRE